MEATACILLCIWERTDVCCCFCGDEAILGTAGAGTGADDDLGGEGEGRIGDRSGRGGEVCSEESLIPVNAEGGARAVHFGFSG